MNSRSSTEVDRFRNTLMKNLRTSRAVGRCYRQTHSLSWHHSESESTGYSCIVPSVLNETYENAHKALEGEFFIRLSRTAA